MAPVPESSCRRTRRHSTPAGGGTAQDVRRGGSTPRPRRGRALEQARERKLSHTVFLDRLLGIEVTATAERRRAGSLRLAGFPAPRRPEDFDFEAQPGLDRSLLTDLAALHFLDEAANVLFIGPPGVGKTHLAIALGQLAIDAGQRVYYTTAADLAARCHRAAIEGRWATTMRFFAAPQLLVIDELG